MPGQTIATQFSSARTANTLAGGQWQASTSGVPVPNLPIGTVPAPGYTALGTHQVAQTPALVPNSFPAAIPGASRASMPSLVLGNAGTNVGSLVSKGAGVGGNVVSRVMGFLKGGR